jgi:hypothetical protein
MTHTTNATATRLLDEALKNYEQALRTGLKVQEDIGKYWANILAQATTSPHDVQKQFVSLANGFIPVTRKSLQECLQLMEQNSRTSVDLLKKGLEAVQTTNAAETHKKLVEFGEGSLKSLKANARAIIDINNKALNSWISWARSATTEVGASKHQRA